MVSSPTNPTMAFRPRTRKTYRPRRSVRKYRPRRPSYRRHISPIEYKTYSSNASTDVNTTGDVIFLHPLAQGTTDLTRVGRKYCIKSIQLSAQIVPGTGGGVNRFLLVKSMNPNGAAPALTDILSSATTWSLRNRLKLTDYKVLMDKRISFATSADTGPIRKFMKFYKKLNEVVVCNAGNAGTIADVEKTAFFLVCLGDQADGAAESTLGYEVVVKFTDS